MRKRANKKFSLEFHSSYLLVVFGLALTGNYLLIIVITSLILVHELGHFFMARVFGIRSSKIIIYPFGGITKINSLVNLDIFVELLIASAGVISQFIYYLFLSFLYHKSLLREYTMDLYTLYNSRMIFFNLMPIYPLDGGRILYLIICYFFPYKISNNIIIIFSFIFIGILLFFHIYYYSYVNIIFYFVLVYYLIKFYDKRNYLYNLFLLERYLYSISFSKVKRVNNFRFMYKNRSHIIFNGKEYVKENTFLKNLFCKK